MRQSNSNHPKEITWFAHCNLWTLGIAGACWVSVESVPVRIFLLACLGLIYLSVLAAGAAFPQLGFFLPALNRGPSEHGAVALTFDANPDDKLTSKLLELLQQEKVPAAFFVAGEAAKSRPAWLKRLDAAGHLVGNHGYQVRRSWIPLPLREITRELEQANQTLASILKRRPRFVRLPTGMTRPGVSRILHRLNLLNIGWDIRAQEGGDPDPKRLAAELARGARNGSILLLESSAGMPKANEAAVLETVRQTIAHLRERGFTFSRLDEMLGQDAYEET